MTDLKVLSCNWGERSEPHTCGENGKLSIYMYIYIYGTCVFRICILPYLCAMQYFRIAYWVHVLLLAQETRLERLNSGNQRNRDLKTVRKGRHY